MTSRKGSSVIVRDLLRYGFVITLAITLAGLVYATESDISCAPSLSDIRTVLGGRLPVSDLGKGIDAISQLSAMISQDQSDNFLQQAADILTTYIKNNIKDRKTASNDIDLRDGLFKPRDIILAIQELAKIHDVSGGRIEIRLADTDFSRINFDAPNMMNFYFDHSSFDHANLSRCRCNGANFNFANLRGVIVWNADFSGAKFQGADLSDSRWATVIFEESNIEEALNHARVRIMATPIGLRSDQEQLFPMRE